MPERSPYDLLADELDRTSVISGSFKGVILAYAGKIAEVAYRRGRESVLPAVPEGARYRATYDGRNGATTVYLKERPVNDGSSIFPWGAPGWDPEVEPPREGRIFLTDEENETVEPLDA